MLFWNRFPFIRITLFFSSGIFSAYYIPLPISVTFGIWLIAFLFFVLATFIFKKSIFRRFNIVLGFIAMGVIYFSGYMLLCLKITQNEKGNIKPPVEEVEAYISAFEIDQGFTTKSKKWIASIEATKHSGLWLPANEKILMYLPMESDFKAGDRILISGTPSAIRSPEIPFAFDYRAYMSRRFIRFTDFVGNGKFRVIGHKKISWPIEAAFNLKTHLTTVIISHFPDSQVAGIMLALLTGNRNQVDPDTYSTFRNTGIVHILAVSGLHVGIIFLVLNMIFSPLQKWGWGKWIKLFLTILALFTFALITGLSPSVNRAVLMFSIIQLGKTMNRQASILNHIFLSMFILLAINPYYLFEVGFQLSYAAVLGIVLLYPALDRLFIPDYWILRKVYQLIVISLCAQLATLPFMLYYFHQFPAYFLLSNILAIPFAFFIVLSGILFLITSQVTFISSFLVIFIGHVCEVFLWAMNGIEKLPNAVIYPISINLVQTILIAAIIFSFYYTISNQKISWLKFLVFNLVLTIGFDFKSKWDAAGQKNLIEYSIPNVKCIELVNGNESLVIVQPFTSQQVASVQFQIENRCIRERHTPRYISYDTFKSEFPVRKKGRFVFFNWGEYVYKTRESDLVLTKSFK